MSYTNFRKIPSLDSPEYPTNLKEISSPPQQLYVRGNVELLSADLLITIVGSRRITSYGKQVLHHIIPPFVRAGAVIVSGLAFGIDAFAHQVTLEERGKCIAVLGSGVDVITPRTNIPIARRILETGGAIISEYEPGTEARPEYFPARNRIMTGLSKATLVIEAREKSGSLISARFALEQNREVFAVPGSIFSDNQKGTNWLISEGARPILSAGDLLSQLGVAAVSQTTMPLQFGTLEEQKIYDLLREPRSIDELARDIALPTPKICELLSLLELSGVIKNLGNMRFGR